MAHAILTCKNHPNLRWSCKDEAISNGGYNGARSLFFDGEPTGEGMYHDGSGLNCSTHIPERNEKGELVRYRVVSECACSPRDLILAPEDKLVKRN